MSLLFFLKPVVELGHGLIKRARKAYERCRCFRKPVAKEEYICKICGKVHDDDSAKEYERRVFEYLMFLEEDL